MMKRAPGVEREKVYRLQRSQNRLDGRDVVSLAPSVFFSPVLVYLNKDIS